MWYYVNVIIYACLSCNSQDCRNTNESGSLSYKKQEGIFYYESFECDIFELVCFWSFWQRITVNLGLKYFWWEFFIRFLLYKRNRGRFNVVLHICWEPVGVDIILDGYMLKISILSCTVDLFIGYWVSGTMDLFLNHFYWALNENQILVSTTFM